MNTTHILSKAQAEAVYSAMCALNNVGARLDAFLENAFHAREMADGRVVVHIVPNVTFPGSHAAEPEIYADQSASAAYGLDHSGEYPNAVAAAAGGLTQTAIER